MVNKLSLPAFLFLALVACSGRHQDAEDSLVAAPDAATLPAPSASSGIVAPALTATQLSSVCKAAIASSFGRSASIMRVVSNEGGVVRIRYNRPDDKTLWTNDCRVEGDRIVWRTVDAFGGAGPGVWRTRPDDDVLTFRTRGKKVDIVTRYAGGSETNTATFPML
jgi:hypothetical protein